MTSITPFRPPGHPHITNINIFIFVLPAQTDPRPTKAPDTLYAELESEWPYFLAGTAMAVVVLGLITAWTAWGA
ncbi:MAG: hypothetical protein GY801_20600 [bacterium]|nr:hypothetical protein [bacterium]